MDEATKVTLMLEAIEESKKSKPEDNGIHPMVGAVLANNNGEILARAHRGENGNGEHAEFILLKKAIDSGYRLDDTSLFVTLEPCTVRGPGKIPCARRIAESGIGTVFIGTLDPDPRIRGTGEMYLRKVIRVVERFPSNLVKLINAINSNFVELHQADLIPTNSLFVSQQIPNIMVDVLKRAGLTINSIPVDWDITIEHVVQYCNSVCTGDNISNMVKEARRIAFDKKYANYSYDKDVRGSYDWKSILIDIFKSLNIDNISSYRTINVGIGNGEEGKDLLNSAQNLTLIDIGQKSLQTAKAVLPKAKTVIADAEDLSQLESASYDIYISLRTYQSSYFDISQALKEAQRIIRPGGIIVISIANGFIGKEGALVYGLVIPGTNVVDKNKPYELADSIRRKLTTLQFGDIGLRTSASEIFVYGRKVY